LQAGVVGGVIWRVVGRAAPDDAAPGAAEGAERAWVVVTTLARVVVAASSPGFQLRVLWARVPSTLRRRLLHAQRNVACLRLPDPPTVGVLASPASVALCIGIANTTTD
jgi:hypothetical protein